IREEKAQELVGLWNAGYEAGPMVPRCNMEKNIIERFQVYCPKAFASNARLNQTLVTRCIRIPIMVTDNTQVMGREPTEARQGIFADLQRELTIWSIDAMPEIIDSDWNKIVDGYSARPELAAATPRLRQILKPLLVLYDYLNLDEPCGSRPSERANLAKAVLSIIEDKNVSNIAEMDQKVLLALRKVAKGTAVKIHTKDVHDQIFEMDPDFQHDDEDKKLVIKVGIILDKYFSENKRKVAGKTEWLSGFLSTDARIEAVEKVLRRLKIDFSDSLDENITYNRRARTEGAKK
ncbi:MAG TPA: hypothetical protein VLH13_01065, partial [Methanomassiliicoccales archaeon]|nr:hypothetical protein [Methanomassiliicoccales archaeon]